MAITAWVRSAVVAMKTCLIHNLAGHRDPNDELLSNLRGLLNLSNTRVKVRFVVPDPDAK